MLVSLERHWNSAYDLQLIVVHRFPLPVTLTADGFYIETGEIDTVREPRRKRTYNLLIANNEVRLSDFATWLKLCANDFVSFVIRY